MSDFLSIKDDSEPPQPEPKQAVLPRISTSSNKLFPCYDCEKTISRYAEHCPHCGRFFQRFDSGVMTVDRRGWASTVAAGILLAVVLPWLVIFVVAIIFIASTGALAGLTNSPHH